MIHRPGLRFLLGAGAAVGAVGEAVRGSVYAADGA
jgi:hypothetical protein